MTHHHPVHFHVEHPPRLSRLQLGIRVLAFMVLGMLGLSFASVMALAYLALPIYAASRLASRGEAGGYLAEEGPGLLRVLRWLAAFSAWAGLTVEQLPSRHPEELVRLEVDPGHAHPTPGSALARVLTGIPSALVLMLLGAVGILVWLWAALSILFSERVGVHAWAYLVGIQRWSVRLLVYQASLVDDYPPFSLSEHGPGVPEATAMT
jgi:hypothetical protein